MDKKIKLIVGIVLSTVLLDQITKHLIRSSFEVFQSIPLGPLLSLTYVQNTGAAFSIFTNMNTALIFISLAIIGGMMWYLPKVKKQMEYSAFALVLGGAIGNLIDRVLLGFVVDFVDLHWWPVFNVADSAISVGVVLLIYSSIKQ